MNDRFVIKCGDKKIIKNKKADKVSWKYKKSAIKAFIRTIACRNGWYGYVDYATLYDVEIMLVDSVTDEVLCKARLHNDEKYRYLPRYSITPIDEIAKEFYKSI